jgi:hypothetical protein
MKTWNLRNGSTINFVGDEMDNDYMGIERGAYASQGALVHKEQPIRVQLANQLAMYDKETDRIAKMIKLLDENPAIEQFINLQRGYTD